MCPLSLLPKPAATIKVLVFDSVIFFSISSISASLILLFFAARSKETIFELFSIKLTISGANVFFEFPARSFNLSRSAFNIIDSFFIKSIRGAVRLFFSISFKYEGATPIFFANSLCPILCFTLKLRI